MISTLNIKNIGIIESITINLNEGFNVITGETGAGKTLIIDSLSIVCGNRFSKEIIRKGENFCLVELNLYLPNHPLAIEGNITVSREVFLNGRNTCKINGRLVTVNELKKFMNEIIDIHGQNENQSIMSKEMHINYLDNFIGENISEFKVEYEALYKRFRAINSELDKNYGDDKEKQRKIDLLNYQINEIDAANLFEGEEETLETERKMFLNAEKIYENLSKANNSLEEQVVNGINSAIKAFEKIEGLNPEYEKKLTELRNVYYDIQEISRDVSYLDSELEFDESRRNEVEKRLDLILDLKRKYGNNIKEILNYREDIQKEINSIENLEEQNILLKKERNEILNKMKNLGLEMHQIRYENALVLSEKINQELRDLEMKNASFYVKVEAKDSDFNKNGIDDVEFLIKTNIGDEEKSLVKIASGGEISRIMLAIKTVLADSDCVSTLVFDEIDTGISGKAAKSVGEKIKIISKKHQVMCITHQANIAAKADYNYYISKEVKNNQTYTRIRLLDEPEVIKEIARISSGDVTKNALEHAKEMRNNN